MPPSGLAILLGAGPTAGAGIARILASPQHGNLAVALLSRTGDAQLANSIAQTSGGGVLKAFSSDTSESSLKTTFDEVKKWGSSISPDLKLKLGVFSIKNSHKIEFEKETASAFTEDLTVYATGAMIFSQLAIKWMTSQTPNSEGQEMEKAGTLVFTGTLGSLRTNQGYAAYGAARASVRMLAQSLAREYSGKGIHVVHAIANGAITDKNEEDKEAIAQGKKMKAESVGKLYLSMMNQECDLWTHELDMRPAAEKF